eukprot:GHVL01027119.1.p1 GENE.GHVL01027119.1~~GHVL01027119.1.p1  ORF type:complete len:282 (-),score=30.45 GHVL01027119.1:145-990(-)
MGNSPDDDLANAFRTNFARFHGDDGYREKMGRMPRINPRATAMADRTEIHPPSDPSQFGDIHTRFDDDVDEERAFSRSFFHSTVLIKKNRLVTHDDLKDYFTNFPKIEDYRTQSEYKSAYYKHQGLHIPAYLAQYPADYKRWLRPRIEALDDKNSDEWFNLRAAAMHREDLELSKGSDLLRLQVQNKIAADALRFRMEDEKINDKKAATAKEKEQERKQVIGVTRFPSSYEGTVPNLAKHTCFRCGKGGHVLVNCRSKTDTKGHPLPKRTGPSAHTPSSGN